MLPLGMGMGMGMGEVMVVEGRRGRSLRDGSHGIRNTQLAKQTRWRSVRKEFRAMARERASERAPGKFSLTDRRREGDWSGKEERKEGRRCCRWVGGRGKGT